MFYPRNTYSLPSKARESTNNMAKYIESANAKLEAFLAQQNKVTEVLGKLEKTTGIKKLYLAQGKSSICLFVRQTAIGSEWCCFAKLHHSHTLLLLCYCSSLCYPFSPSDDDDVVVVVVVGWW